MRGGTELVVTEESRRPATRAAATCQVPVNIRESPSYTVYLGDGLGRLGAGGGKAACCGGYAILRPILRLILLNYDADPSEITTLT